MNIQKSGCYIDVTSLFIVDFILFYFFIYFSFVWYTRLFQSPTLKIYLKEQTNKKSNCSFDDLLIFSFIEMLHI